MAKAIKLVEGTAEKKFSHIERILQRFSRRLHKTVIGAMPPIPIFAFTNAADSDGVVFEWMSPVAGIITNVCLYIENIEASNPVEFTLSVLSSDESRFLDFSAKKQLTIDRVNIPARAGSRVMLTTKSPEAISGVWVAFLLEVGLREMKKEVFLIDEFEKVIDNEVKEDEDG